MKKRTTRLYVFAIVLVSVLTLTFSHQAKTSENTIKPEINVQKTADIKSRLKPDLNFGKVPLYFIPNKGQVNAKALFYAKTPAYTLWMTKEGLVFDSIKRVEDKSKKEKTKLPYPDTTDSTKHLRDVSSLLFVNANKNPEVVAIDMTKHQANYFIGNDKKKWRKNIATSKAVLYKEVYKNIDLKVYGVNSEIEYDWIVRPGGDPKDIQFEYKNVKNTTIDKDGNLVVKTEFGELTHKRPVSFQLNDKKKVPVHSSFACLQNEIYKFTIGKYNPNVTLYIDPLILAYSTYFGGNSSDFLEDIEVSDSGHFYITGKSNSTDLPINFSFGYNPQSNYLYVVKFTPDGQNILYSTFFGGSGDEFSYDLAIDSSDCAYITGYTDSSNFPTSVSAYQSQKNNSLDAFITKLSASGNTLSYSTYLGGGLIDSGKGIAADNNGSAYVAGTTESIDFPTYNAFDSSYNGGLRDVFITKIAPDGSSLQYSTYVGGNLIDGPSSIAIDNLGSAYITGDTTSNNFPVQNATQSTFAGGNSDSFVTKVAPDGMSLIFSSYLGGSSEDFGNDISVDSNGFPYIIGTTYSSDFPVNNNFSGWSGGDTDCFITKISNTGNTLIYSTFLGGSLPDHGRNIKVDNIGSVYITGYTNSSDFPTSDPYQNNLNGTVDCFIAKISFNGSNTILNFSTYFGGSAQELPTGMTIDNNNSIYIAGTNSSSDLPLQSPYINTYQENFISKFNYVDPNSITILSPNGGELWYTNENRSITWNYVGIDDTELTRIILLKGGTVVDTIAENIQISDGTFAWDVGQHNSGTAPAGNDYRIRIQTVSGSYSDDSNGNFSIADPSITVTSPNGGESLMINTLHVITWDTTGFVGDVAIDYSINNATSWNVITASTPNDGAHPWTVPTDLSSNCLIRITDTDGSPSDQSDTVFTITNEPEIPECADNWGSVAVPGTHNGVVYGIEKFVSVGHSGVINTSADGLTWTPRTSGVGNYLIAVTHDGAQFVVAGYGGTILTSPDGITWTSQDSTTTQNFRGITYGSGVYVAVGNSGTIVTSSDSENWASSSSGTTQTLYSVSYGNGLFVAVGNSGTLLTSPDGTTWTARTSGTANKLKDSVWADNLWVTVGNNGTLITSPDGITWTARSPGTSESLFAITYGSNMFVAAGTNGAITASTLGITWEVQNSNSTATLTGVAFGNTIFAITGVGTILSNVCDTVCSQTWGSAPAGGTYNHVAYSAPHGRFVAVGNNGLLSTSTDGMNWVDRDSETQRYLIGVTNGGGLFIVAGYNGTILTSGAGKNWTERSSGTTTHLRTAGYGSGLWLVSGNSGEVHTSPDGINWTARSSGTSQTIYGTHYANGLHLLLGSSGTIVSSPDAINWTVRSSGSTAKFKDAAYGNSTWVVAGNGGAVVTSSDGINWTTQTSGTTENIFSVTYEAGTFVAACNNGLILTSPDGITWTPRSSGTGNALLGVRYGGNTFSMVGVDTILYSTCD